MMTSSNGSIFRVIGPQVVSPVDSPHISQWREALVFSLMCAWTNGWANKRQCREFQTPWLSLWRHCYIYIYIYIYRPVLKHNQTQHSKKHVPVYWRILEFISHTNNAYNKHKPAYITKHFRLITISSTRTAHTYHDRLAMSTKKKSVGNQQSCVTTPE